MTFLFIISVIFFLMLFSFGINNIRKYRKLRAGIVPLLFAIALFGVALWSFGPAMEIFQNGLKR